MYDFPDMFREACKTRWILHVKQHSLPKSVIPKEFVRFTELVLDSHDHLIEIHRVPGQNDTGMIAWKMTLFVPEYPEGRDVIVIANDITFKIGTFGPEEDKLYMRASEFSRAHKLPRIYLSGKHVCLVISEIFKSVLDYLPIYNSYLLSNSCLIHVIDTPLYIFHFRLTHDFNLS